jgi:hypothetical protein
MVGVDGQGQGGGRRRWVVALAWRRLCGIHALRQLREAHEGKEPQTASGYKKESDGLKWRANGQGQCPCGTRGVAVDGEAVAVMVVTAVVAVWHTGISGAVSVEHLVLFGAWTRPAATSNQPVTRGLRIPAQPAPSHIFTSKPTRFFEVSFGIEQRSQCCQEVLLISLQNIGLESRMRMLCSGRRDVCGARLTQIYLTMCHNLSLAFHCQPTRRQLH